MVKSIFDLEKRTDLSKEVTRLDGYLREKIFLNADGYTRTFWGVINEIFTLWPHRYTATTLIEYFELFQITPIPSHMNEEQMFYYLQFIYDFIMWIENNSQIYIAGDNISDVYHVGIRNREERFNVIKTNIELIAELMNYKLEYINDHYTFIKRDADVDSVIKQLETEEDLRLALLSYNDFRIEEDIKEKKIILKQIGDWLEPNRKNLSSINKCLTDDIFFVLNKAEIRHNNENELELDDNSILQLYDELFKMILHLLRESDIKNIQQKIKKMKS